MARRRPLVDRLPQVRGRLTADAPLARFSWFRVGGPAEALFEPADADDLAAFLAAKPADVPLTVIGLGANLLIRDGGVPGVVVRLGRGFDGIAIEGDELVGGAGAVNRPVAIAARDAGLGGLEFLCGIPGTLGGALRMNAGAYGREMKDVAVAAWALDGHGRKVLADASAIDFRYRGTRLPEDWIVVQVRLRGRPDDRAAIAERMAAIDAERAASQPLQTPTGGSTFVNPPGAKAWELIDRAGCRGLRLGGAMVSEKHCNFLINEGQATAADLEALGEEVRRRVRESQGVELAWEIRRLGVRAGEGRPA